MSADPADSLRDLLVAWYRAHRRDLPWRRAPTPYAVLLSELMLQQTRVETVIPYFERFLARWPTLAALAQADEDEVLRAWAGLGYYRRARSLLAAARAAHADGGLPSDPAELARLPGVGPYTAGAIASIAFGVPAAAVDGNVERVIARVDALDGDPKRPPTRDAIRARAAELSAPGVASDVTQGLMELGATVCTPRAPACGICPWTEHCRARAAGREEELPHTAKRKAPTPVRGAAGLLRRGDLVLLGKRPSGLLGGLWEPVMIEGDAAGPDLVRAAFRERAGLDVTVTAERGAVVHTFTHRRLTLSVFDVVAAPEARVRSDGSYEELAFLPADAPGVALSVLASKVLAAGDGLLPLASEPAR